MKKISVLMPVFNEEKFILEAVNSVIKQTHKNFELIIIDDQSTDSTLSILKKINDDRVKVLENKNKGKNEAFNLGYSVSSGDWIVFFAGDDIMPQNSLELRLEKVADNDPHKLKIGAYGKLKMISNNKKFDGVIIPKNEDKGTESGGTLILSRKMADTIFPIPTELGNEDQWSVLTINHFADKIIDIPSIVLEYRIHEENSNSQTSTFEKKNAIMHKRNIVYKKFAEYYKNELDYKELEILNAIAKAEYLRYQGKSIMILVEPKLSINNRMRFFMYSNKFLYNIRKIFFNLFSGWG
jgi:glycosyltransferase involved in cell wall biosynthesis